MLVLRGSKLSKLLFFLVFLIPTLVLYLWLFYVPNISSIPMSFFKWKIMDLTKSPFVGFDNYIYLWNDREIILKTVGNNLFLSFWELAIGLVLALLFCGLVSSRRMQKSRFVQLYRSIMYFPNMVPILAMAVVWSFFFSPIFGPISPILDTLGFKEVAAMGVLGNVNWVKPSLVLTGLMGSIGYNFVILLAAISTVSQDYYEAAELDGASSIKQFFSITLPLIRGTIITLILLALASTFSAGFATIKTLTNGGPSRASEILSGYMYHQAFDKMNLGYGSAISTLMFILAVGLYGIFKAILKHGEGSYE